MTTRWAGITNANGSAGSLGDVADDWIAGASCRSVRTDGHGFWIASTSTW